MNDDIKDAERFRWLIKQGVAWRDCYDRDWLPGEWLYEAQDARHFVDEAMMRQFTPGQRALIRKHGTVSDFAIACHLCVPSDISYEEAEAAIQKYRREFNKA